MSPTTLLPLPPNSFLDTIWAPVPLVFCDFFFGDFVGFAFRVVGWVIRVVVRVVGFVGGERMLVVVESKVVGGGSMVVVVDRNRKVVDSMVVVDTCRIVVDLGDELVVS